MAEKKFCPAVRMRRMVKGARWSAMAVAPARASRRESMPRVDWVPSTCRLTRAVSGTMMGRRVRVWAEMGLRFYFTGENLFYWAPGLHCDYIDPEMAQTNGNLRIYPWQKTIMFGIDVTL